MSFWVLEAWVLHILHTLKSRYYVWYYMTDMTSLFFFLLHFIPLMSWLVFLVMINIRKTEKRTILKNPCQIFFSVYHWNCVLSILLSFGQDWGFKMKCFKEVIKWIKLCSNILSSTKIINFNEWVEIESFFINKTFQLGKRIIFFGQNISIELRC